MEPLRISFLVLLLALMVVTSAFAKQVEISGKYCYQYGDSESLMIAKEISYAMALRKAIETYKTFISSTSIVKDFKLKKDIIEAIASGYVDNIKIIKQDVKGRTVCTTLIGYVNPDAVKSIISRKVEKVRKAKRKEFEGLLSNSKIKILSIKKQIDQTKKLFSSTPEIQKKWEKCLGLRPLDLYILYQAKRDIQHWSVRIIFDCFDKDGNPMEGTLIMVPSGSIAIGEVRRTSISLPQGTVSYEVRLK
jgi:hypothetical protein